MSDAPIKPRPSPYFVGITGGSGSGKTTIANLVAAHARAMSSVIVSEDDYYIDHSRDPQFDPVAYNYDNIHAHDHDLLAEQLRDLGRGRDISAPRYTFATHSRSKTPVRQHAAALVIVEGIHCLYPEDLRALFDFKIYIDVPDDIRLLRRLKRDAVERGRSIDDIMRQYIKTVRPMHYLYTYPTMVYADLIVRPKIEIEASDDDSYVMSQLKPLLSIIS